MDFLPCTLDDWARLGIVGQVHYGRPAQARPYAGRLARLTAQALQTITTFVQVTESRGYVSMSFGKDSLVAWHLTQQIAPLPAVVIRRGPLCDWPDCLALEKALQCAPYGLQLIELQTKPTLLEVLQGTALGNNHPGQTLIAHTAAAFCEAQSMRGQIWGLRGVREPHREALHREILLASKGILYQRQDSIWMCSPVGRWTTRDIWAYIDWHGLPYAAMYDLGREIVRNGAILGAGQKGVSMGRGARLHQLFPRIWAVAVRAVPDLARLG